MAKPLNERLAGALTDNRVRLADLEALKSEVQAARDAQIGVATQAAGDELNFALSADQRNEAAQTGATAKRETAVLTSALEALEARIAERRAKEGAKAREEERRNLIAERDALAERIKSEWPDLASRMIELLSEIADNDARLKAAGVHVPSAEAIARGCDPAFKHSGIVPIRRLTQIALPDFADGTRLAWPIERPAGKHWTELSEDNRRAQVRQMHERATREAEDWALFDVLPGTCKVYETQFTGKLSRNDPHTTTLSVYSEAMAFGDAALKPQPVTAWLRSGEVARLRRLGLSVTEHVEIEEEADA